MRLFRFCLLFLLSCVLLPAQEISIVKPGEKISGFPVEIYEDSSGELDFDAIQKVEKFQPYTSNISKGYSRSAFWIRFSVVNRTHESLAYTILLTETYLDRVDTYIRDASNRYSVTHHGVGYFKQDTLNNIAKPEILLTLKPGERKRVFIRMRSNYPVFTAIHLYTEIDKQAFTYKVELMHMMFLGAVLALVLYNLGIFFFIKDSAYLYYIFFVSGFAAWQMLSIGIFPFDHFSSTRSFYTLSMVIPIFQAFLFLFTRALLDLKGRLEHYNKILIAAALLYIVLALGMLVDPGRALFIMNTVSSLLLPFLLWIGYKSYKEGNKIAIYFLIAQFSFLSMGTLFALAAYGILEFNLLTRYGIILGSFGEMIFFALALAYRIKLLQKEKLLLIEQANKELDVQVRLRTRQLENAKNALEDLASKDALTNLYNRRSLFEYSSKLIGLAKREKSPLSLIMFDIDEFKNINDTYGHGVGDSVITLFADQLKQGRRSDIAARIGGEEFILVCPNTDLDAAFNVAEQIRNVCETLSIKTEKGLTGFTVSAGVSTLVFDEDNKIDDLILRADKALYQAKSMGRNSVIRMNKV